MKSGIRSVSVFSPAKVNLFLAVTGKRPDGFHDILSVAAPLLLGDVVTIEARAGHGEVDCLCPELQLPAGEDNIAARAARVWLNKARCEWNVCITISKRIPVGGGLGGGSSNAVATLHALNLLAKVPLPFETLLDLAGELGSDCPLFLFEEPCLLEGRGESVKPLPAKVSERFRGGRLLLFAPSLGMDTPEVYDRLARNPSWYSDMGHARALLATWTEGSDGVDALLANDLQKPIFEQCPGFPVLLEDLSENFGWTCGMSGSGSCCFALLDKDLEIADGIEAIRSAWGEECFVEETAFA